ncbi:hypothetical protein J4H86_05970 [Spiractinospora alimapuensis]|uniref:hypothetical protein n=1 Tax=Spiractinospora alimapuensis TaxID=2820884 RepID=UPI001F223DC1|nr:hypothetical protein [Spiractinospora alimapuensis]QVQ53313.1 hypothetical protein J4H86_05970 [Spiractinospora alimapuensis]
MSVLVIVLGLAVVGAVMAAALLGGTLLRAGERGKVMRVGRVVATLALVVGVPTTAAVAVLRSAPDPLFLQVYGAALLVVVAILGVNVALPTVAARRSGGKSATTVPLSPAALSVGLLCGALVALLCSGVAVAVVPVA